MPLPKMTWKCLGCGTAFEGDSCRICRKDHTAQTLEEMTGPEAQALAERLAVQLCGSDRFKTDLATRLGYSRPAVNGWFAEGGRPPAIVIMYMLAEMQRADAVALLETLNGALDDLRLYRAGA